MTRSDGFAHRDRSKHAQRQWALGCHHNRLKWAKGGERSVFVRANRAACGGDRKPLAREVVAFAVDLAANVHEGFGACESREGFSGFLSKQRVDVVEQRGDFERGLIVGIVLGVLCMFQPWLFAGYRFGFLLVLFATLGFIVWSHITPAIPQYDE